MFSRSPLDWGLVVLYFGFLVAVWLRLIGRPSDAADYLVAGRRVTLPALVATLVTTWYGGILGVGEYSYRYGISNWLVFGVPYYLGALLFALFFARRARRAELFTVPELLQNHYAAVPRSWARSPSSPWPRLRLMFSCWALCSPRCSSFRSYPACSPPSCSRSSTSRTAACAASCSAIRSSSFSCMRASSSCSASWWRSTDGSAICMRTCRPRTSRGTAAIRR